MIPIDNIVWKKLINEEIDFKPTYLAAKIALSNVRLKLKFSTINFNIDQAVKDLYEVYKSGDFLPTAKADLEKLSTY